MVFRQHLYRELYPYWIVPLGCLISFALSAVRHESDLSGPSMGFQNHAGRSSMRRETLKTNAERMNVSRRLWELFQSRNQASEYSSSVLRYPSSRKTGPSVELSIPPRRRLSTNQSGAQSFNRRLADPLQILHTDPQPAFPINMPRFPPEHPFNPRAVLAPSEMLRLLGENNYIPEFMSYVKPMEAATYPEGRLSSLRSYSRLNRRPSEIQSRRQYRNTGGAMDSVLTSDLNKRLQTIGHSLWNSDESQTVYQFSRLARGARPTGSQRSRKDRRHARIKRRVRRALKRLLADYTSCPVLYRWHDWGSRFWPRWIKQGQCVDLGETSCSIPPGMYCTEAEHRTIVVLRFLCFTSWPRSSCAWYRLNIPVLSRCQCGCSAKSNRMKQTKHNWIR
ncbi:hypothetical protein FBUS_03046 [Fasciolopsis buskii]|uniref:Noggin n=1 Tax=Fasciolopsis buskii TaxID=27845 RepID=A0A8E0VHJ1_9TREM|nr:hypothetical protein FBUS_03046 [Fasciolopsis buski]